MANWTVHFLLQQKEGSKKELTVLDAKRSNAINIGLTSLPPPRAIKTAILKMDNAVMNRESIEVSPHLMNQSSSVKPSLFICTLCLKKNYTKGFGQNFIKFSSIIIIFIR